jgi:hypothetical protein
MHLTWWLQWRCIDEGVAIAVHTDQGKHIMIPAIDMQRVLQRTLSGAIASGQLADAGGRSRSGDRTARKRRWLLRRG